MTASRPTAASATAVTAGGMLISSRLGSTISPGRSTVKNLVRKACKCETRAWVGRWAYGCAAKSRPAPKLCFTQEQACPGAGGSEEMAEDAN